MSDSIIEFSSHTNGETDDDADIKYGYRDRKFE